MKISKIKRDWEASLNSSLVELEGEDENIKIELDSGEVLIFWTSEWGGVYIEGEVKNGK